jgi:hypothetical protein
LTLFLILTGSYDNTPRQQLIFATLLIIAASSGFLLSISARHSQQIEQERLNALAFSRQAYEKRLDQCTELLSSLTAADIADAASRSAYSAADLENAWKMTEMRFNAEEARWQRDHERLMAEVGNKATIEQVREKLKGEIEMLDKRLQHEKAPADVEVAERKVRRQSMYDTLGEIFEIQARDPDPKLGDQLFEMWQRGAF